MRVAGALEEELLEPEPEVVPELELDPQALTETVNAHAAAVATLSHLGDMEYFSFIRFIAREARGAAQDAVTRLWPECEKVVNARHRTDIQTRNACG
jgi:hypothetical protein